MSGFFGFMSVVTFCATVLFIAFIVVLAMPQSKMREVLKPALLAVMCLIYVVSPIDLAPAAVLGPFGAVDDMAAVYAGVKSLRKAIHKSESLSA